MRLIILTSSRKGTASYCIPILSRKTDAQIVQVVYSRGEIKKDLKYYRKRLRKILRIGLLGALNGVRIRSWFQGEGMRNQLEDIETLCARLDIPFFETPFIGHADTIEIFRRANADLGVSLGNPYIPAKVYSIPKLGMINIHGEVLPGFQNAQSVIWQIYEGNSVTGYTIHKIDRHIDTGDILHQEQFPIPIRESLEKTVRAGVDEILTRAGEGLAWVISHFSSLEPGARPQGGGKKYTTPSFSQFRKMQSRFRTLKKKAL